ncbi:MAG: LysM peptidoglycan-binding domain-containing protein [Desulfobacterales bacterium]
MVCGKQHRMAKAILPLTLLCILIACTYQQPPLQPAPGEPPPPVETGPETPVAAPDTPTSEVPVQAPSGPRFYLHKVLWPGETLSHIATWYTGTITNWKAIAKVNPELDPSKIHVGDTISIPEDLLTSRNPMPHFFVRASIQKEGVSLSSPRRASTPLESPKLFGPLESESSSIEPDSPELFGPLETGTSTVKPDETKLFGPIE